MAVFGYFSLVLLGFSCFRDNDTKREHSLFGQVRLITVILLHHVSTLSGEGGDREHIVKIEDIDTAITFYGFHYAKIRNILITRNNLPHNFYFFKQQNISICLSVHRLFLWWIQLDLNFHIVNSRLLCFFLLSNTTAPLLLSF